jgi:deoxyribose-phosphate aldolase
MPTVDAVMAAERAASFTKRSIKTHTKRAALELALSMLDLTTLEGKDSPEKARSLCRKALRPFPSDEQVLGKRLPNCGAVCVYPALIETCVQELRGTPRGSPPLRGGSETGDRSTPAPEGRGTKIASVATGFPSGQYPLEVRLEDVRRAVAAGADEIDMVISRGQFLAGAYDVVAEEIRETKHACRREDGSYAHLKVILETGELETLDNVRRASDLAIRAMHDVVGSTPLRGVGEKTPAPEGRATNIDFIKTSTGKVQPAATMPVTLVMLEAIRDWYLESGCIVGMKPAGGIRTAKQAVHYLVMVHETMGPLKVPGFEKSNGNPWLTPDYFRFGASTLCNDILRQLVRLKTGKYVAGYDFSEA